MFKNLASGVQRCSAAVYGSGRVRVPNKLAAASLSFQNCAIVTPLATQQRKRSYCHHASERFGIPRPQERAPDFKGKAVINEQIKEIQLSDYNGKWLILFFYPLDFTFVCPTEIIAFSERADEFRALNCEVIACSTDSHFSHLGWIRTDRKAGGLGPMKIPVLSDYTKTISKSYGLLLEGLGAALRGLFLIDASGIIRHVTVNDLSVGRSVDEAYRVLQAFQFTEKHGEVCPANWKPKSLTINPGSPNKYFSEVNK